MSEPKVVHEWEVDGARLRVVIDGRVCLEELDPQFGWCKNDYIDDDLADELARLAARVEELEAALDQYREDAEEWQCPTCGEWQREWQMYCDKPECRAALKEKP